MKLNKRNVLFIIVVVLLIIPQTRKSIQVLLHKGIALVNPVNVIDKKDRIILNDYSWKLKTETEEITNFNQFKGKVILINFWATWCPPCIAEMASLQKLYNKYEKRVDFIFVTADALDEKISNFKENKKYTFPVYQIMSKPPSELMTTSIPRTVLIDKNGEIIIDKSGAADWFSEDVQKQIDELLK
ncbi:TlpA family protein disulfide reductase [Winogradskyella litorisediminis]|uniref:TlpA family protein disulfide reductase n=1 Tax=Winogradskyella litorisediminis TaxID=1156618 RepID=A0ABW3N893_9FLAO